MRRIIEPPATGRSLRRTLLIWLLLPLLALMSIGTVVVYHISLNILEKTYDRGLFQIADAAAKLSRDSLKNSGKLHIPDIAVELLLEAPSDKVFLSIKDAQGNLVVGDGKLVPPPRNRQAAATATTYYDTTVSSLKVRALATSFTTETAGITQHWNIQVGETLNERESLAHDILLFFLLPQIVIIVLAAALVIFGIRVGLRPLESLVSALSQRSYNDMHALDVPGLPLEIQPIVQETNHLLERMNAVFEAQKHFTADAAHQLRTPLAGLTAQTDLARAQPNPPQTQHALDQIKVVSARLTHAVNQLLSIARNEPGADTSVRMEPLDLNEFGRNTTLEWVEIAISKGIDLGFDGTTEPVVVTGDSTRLKEMLDNLIDNALRYCPRGSSVTVRVAANRTLSVEDNGPGIPPEERERVFERFHRLLGSKADGNGLGLAIVREIADLHSAEVTLTEGTGGSGALFQVKFSR
jgi:two-component system sensor histidine kinase TctE